MPLEFDNQKKLRQNARIKKEPTGVASNVFSILVLILVSGSMLLFGCLILSESDRNGDLLKSIRENEQSIKECRQKITNAMAEFEMYTGSEYITPRAHKLGLRASLPEQRAGVLKTMAFKDEWLDRRYYLGVK